MENAPSTLGTSGVEPGNVMSVLQGLEIKGVKNEDIQKILKEVFAKDDGKEWESLLTAALNVLRAIGQCFIIALSGNAGQVTQTRDKSIPANLRTNLVNCSDLGLATFVEAEDKMANLITTLTAIIDHRGIMEKILNAVEDIGSASQPGSDEDPQASRGELNEQLTDLKQCAWVCTENHESVVKKFTTWHLEVRKINLAYTEAHAEETGNLNDLGKHIEDLQTQLGGIKNNREPPEWVRRMFSQSNKIKKNEGVVRGHLKSLNTQHMNKESVVKVLESSLDNLKQIKESLEQLDRFFKALHRQIEDNSGRRLDNFIRDVSKVKLTKSKVDEIHYDSYKMRCQYIYARSKASIYVKASEEYIIPGVKLINKLNSGLDMSVDDLEEQLFQYYENSQKVIRDFVEKLPVTQTHVQLMKQIQDVCLSSGK